MNNPDPAVFVAAYIATYYTACGRFAVADFGDETDRAPYIVVYENRAAEFGSGSEIGFTTRPVPDAIRPGGVIAVDIFAVDPGTYAETWHARVPVRPSPETGGPPVSYPSVVAACENGVAFD